MSVCVVGSSAWESVVLPSDQRGDQVIDHLESLGEWWAPDAFDLEVLYALRGHLLRGALEPMEFQQQADLLARLPLSRLSRHSLNLRIASLAPSISTYDAAFVAVAELLDAPLITTDARLVRALGPRCEFLLVEGN